MAVHTWSESDLAALGAATELQVASRRGDGTLRTYITIWGVRVGDAVYVRSAYGSDNPWYRRARSAGRGAVRGGGVEHDVTFTAVDPADPVHAEIDTVYHRKYDRYGQDIVGTVVGAHATDVTLRLDPLD